MGVPEVFKTNAGQDAPPAKILCMFYNAGKCLKGTACPFLHDPGFAQPMPATSVYAKNKVPCKFFRYGQCQKLSNCEFSHDLNEGPIPLKEKMEAVCTYFVQGKCTRGVAFPFAHGEEEMYEIFLAKAGLI